MRTRLTAIATAAAVALGSAAGPAAAQSDEELLGRILAGAAILGITAKIIDNRKDREEEEARRAAAAKKKKKAAEVARQAHDDRRHDGNWRVIEGEISPVYGSGRKSARKARNKPLPRDCRVVVDTPRGDRIGYSSSCLGRSFDYARYLPPECEVLVKTSHGLRGVYGERCLARDGWKTVER